MDLKNNILKIFSIILMVAMIINVSNVSLAFDTQGHTDEQIAGMQGPGNSGTAGESLLNPSVSLITPDTGGATGKNTQNIVNVVVGTIQIIGVAAAIIMLVFLAIKYVSAAPSEKADIKKGAVIYIVGAVFLFGASVILGFVRDFITQIGG